MWCPSCLGPTPNELHCARCGFPQAGPDAARLRVVRYELNELGERTRELTETIARLDAERADLTRSLWAETGRGEFAPAWSKRDDSTAVRPARWRPERVRDALLWLGATLLALAAVTFVVVAWTRMVPEVRAAVLIGTTFVAGTIGVLLRRRLRPTAEAMMALTGSLLVVDWFALARAGVGPGADDASWWALGCAVVAALSLGASAKVDLQIVRVFPAVLFPTAGALAIADSFGSAWIGAIGYSGLAVLVVLGVRVTIDKDGWRIAGGILRVAGVAANAVAAIFGVAAVAVIDSGSALPAAFAVLVVGMPAALALTVRRSDAVAGTDGVLSFVVSGAVIGAALTALSRGLGDEGLLVLAAVTGVCGLLVARVLARRFASGVSAASLVAIWVAGAEAASAYFAVFAGSWHSWSDPWTGWLSQIARASLAPSSRRLLWTAWNGGVWQAAAIAAAVAAGAVLVRRLPTNPDGPHRVHFLDLVAAAASAAALVMLTIDARVSVVVLVLGTGMLVSLSAGVLVRDRGLPWSAPALFAGAVLAVPVAGWSTVDERASIVIVGVLALSSFGLIWLVRNEPLRRVLVGVATVGAIAEAGVVALALTDRWGPTGLTLTIAAAVVTVGARVYRRSAPTSPVERLLEVLGIVGMALGVTVAMVRVFDGSVWPAHALTVVLIALAVGALRRERARGYVDAATAVAILVVCAWLSVADVAAVEAYSLPAAAILVGHGLTRRAREDGAGSWVAYGGGLMVSFLPSLVIALRTGGAIRPTVLIVAAFAAVGLGARSRLQAPIAIGSLTLVVLAIEGVAPAAVAVPRWALLATIGVIVLWLGASADRRLDQLHRFRATLERMT